MNRSGFPPRAMLQIALCAAVTFSDGFDTQAIGYVAPAVIRSFHIDRTALAPVFAAGLFGLMLGALVFGTIADRVGRVPVLVACTAWFGVCSLLTARTSSVDTLLLWRFLTGLGLGGALPNAIAITSDLSPPRVRATTVMVMFCGFSVGAAVGGVAAASLMARYGWPAVFVAGGIFPCLLAVALLVGLSSVRQDSPREVAGVPVVQLFSEGRTITTLLVWLVFFMSLLDLYFVTNWLPTLLTDSGLGVDRAVLVTALFQAGGTVGTLTLGRVFDRRPPFRVLAVTYATAAVLVATIGRVGGSLWALCVVVIGAGFCIVGGQTGANALTATLYPPTARATGVGWALGVGRIGSIVGPLVGGILLSWQWRTPDLFVVGAVPVLIAAAAAAGIAGRVVGQDS